MYAPPPMHPIHAEPLIVLPHAKPCHPPLHTPHANPCTPTHAPPPMLSRSLSSSICASRCSKLPSIMAAREASSWCLHAGGLGFRV